MLTVDTKNLIIEQKITHSLGIENSINVIDQLPVNPHHSWADLGGVRGLDDLTTIVLHHDGMSKASTAKYSDLQLMQNIAKYHINTSKNVPKGDGGFPYDIFIRNGRIYQGNDLLPLKYGVRSNNSYTVHVCMSGDYFNHDVLTDPDRKALIGAILMLKSILPNFKAIKGHGEIVATNCPGYDVKKVRTDVATLESNLAYKETPNAQTAIAFTIATRILDLYDKSKTDGPYKDEAIRKLLLLEPACKEMGLL